MSTHPPGPKGMLHTAFQLAFTPIESLERWQEEYGETFTVNRLGQRIVFTSSPDLIRQLYSVTDIELFGPSAPETVDILLGTESFFLIHGQEHRRERKLVAPYLLGERMRAWTSTMENIAQSTFDYESETTVDMLERAAHATIGIILRLIFGVSDPQRSDQYLKLIHRWSTLIRPGFLFFRFLQHNYCGLSSFARYLPVSNQLDEMLTDDIHAAKNARPSEKTDILSSLLLARHDDGSPMSHNALISQLRTLLFAGYETTASTIAWAVYFSLSSEEVYGKIRAEVDNIEKPITAAEIARMRFLGAVFDESLRLRPVTVDTFRILRKPWRFGDWDLPPGTAISAASSLAHYREDLWPEPNVFRPERFLQQRPNPNIYLPFGGGMRRCIGASFARVEACVILATIFRDFDMELISSPGSIKWSRGPGALQPVGGVHVRMTPRSSNA